MPGSPGDGCGLVVATVSLLLAAQAWPQSPGADCDALPDDAAKLRCFSAIVREIEARIASRQEPAPAEAPRPPTTARVEPAPAVTAAPATKLPAQPAASPTAVAATVDDSAEPAAGVEILAITEGPLGNLTVRLANGEVWRQLDSDNTRVVLPDDRATRLAIIEEGFLGSRRLKIVGTARSFRVRRVD